MEDLIDFNIIEGQKENIQSLPSGRSARTLANLYSVSPLQPLSTPTPADTTNLNDAMRREYEAEVANLSESDDPLDIYDRYVRWNMNAYPSAQATKESQLLPLLERATKTFLKDTQYKNDPRYLKLWLLYIKLFSDAPRETFAFLARHSIGCELALFYEEFAAWLEGAARWTQAEEIYELGLQREARPAARLSRKYKEFQQRQAQRSQGNDGPASPALPTVRAALAAKIDPFSAASAAPIDSQAAQRASAPTSKSRTGKPKMQIFADTEEISPSAMPNDPVKGWDSIGSLTDRRKENAIEPKPWAGETLKAGGKKSSAPKMAIFKDESSRIPINYQRIVPHKEQVTVNERTKKQERIFVNLEAIYPSPDDMSAEMSLEELRAQKDGWLNKTWAREEIVTPILSPPDEIKVFREVDSKEANIRAHSHIKSSRELEHSKTKSKAKLEIFREEVDDFAIPGSVAPISDENGVLTSATRQSATPLPLEVETKIAHDALKSRKMEVFADPGPSSSDDSKSMAVMGLPKDENGKTQTIMLDENGAVKVPLKGSGRKKMRAVEVNETQIIKTKLSSPSGNKKVKRKNHAEPTMTFHTKAATDEIYDLFSQPLTCGTTREEEEVEDDDNDEDTDDDDETDGDYTSGAESTGTGRLIANDADDDDHEDDQDDDDGDARSESEWSEFTTSKHIPGVENDEGEPEDTRASLQSQEEDADADDEEQIDHASDQSLPRTSFIPIPPEDFVAPTRPFRNAEESQQNRLPFMTPIAEKTESSLGALTNRGEKNYFNSKTPSKENHIYSHRNGGPASSPFLEEPMPCLEEKIPQPDLGLVTRTKKTVALVSRAKPTFEVFQEGPVIKDAQCNPVDDYIRDQILENMRPSLDTYAGYSNHKPETLGRSAELRRFCKALSKANKGGNDKTTTNITMAPILTFPSIDRQYTVRRELGAGAYAPVFLLETIDDDETPAEDSLVKTRPTLSALKMEHPPTPWEFYLTRTAKERLAHTRSADSIIDVYEMYLYADEGYLIEEYRDQGTLLDLVNLARADSTQPNGIMDEMITMFFTIELLRTVETLHTHGILHGDLKADNCLVRLDPLPENSTWSSHYSALGDGGWSRKGISLIDFGRGIDMHAFRPEVQFIADWKTSPQDCPEIRNLRPWTYQIDYHGLAGIIHSLLFGKYIETVPVVPGDHASSSLNEVKTYRIKESFKRYWQTELWQRCFDLLLNPTKGMGEEGLGMPCTRGMREVREGMEEWVEGNCERGVGLQAGLRKLEYGISTRRKGL